MSEFKKKRINLGEVTRLQGLLRAASLNTVCESARCPNIGECFCSGTATFLIAGNVCTRSCRFCAIERGRPLPLDPDEPRRIASTVKELKLKYAVITSVTRDDLTDGGAGHYGVTITVLRSSLPDIKIEVLVPDFNGDHSSAQTVFDAKPDVFAHNLETVPRLYPEARAGADYRRSLQLLSFAKNRGMVTKSGIMLGLGEKEDEILQVMDDLRSAGCDILTLGQYLAPSKQHLPVKEYIPEASFEHYHTIALSKGFGKCASGSYVRSSYLAHTMSSFFSTDNSTGHHHPPSKTA